MYGQFDLSRMIDGDAAVASMAHEVRQPLTAIILSAAAGYRFLDRTPADVDRAKAALKRIVTDGHRAGAVLDDIQANFKSDPNVRAAFDVNELIQAALAHERGELHKHGIVVQVSNDDRLPQVRGSWIQLQQLLLNLIVNAIDSMSANEPGSRVLGVRSSAYDAEHVVVSVSDTGAGVAGQEADRIFEAQYTTRKHRIGMGLTICRAIIEAHGGNLWLVPDLPSGADFRFTLRID